MCYSNNFNDNDDDDVDGQFVVCQFFFLSAIFLCLIYSN